MIPPELALRAARVSLLVLDVDGVLTDGRVVYAEHGDELKAFDVQDGAALVFWNAAGFKSAVITGRSCRLVKRRAREMRVDALAQGRVIKLPVYEQLLRRFRMADEQVCVIADDIMELGLMRRAGFAVAVANAAEEIRKASHYVTRRAGGRGAVREVVDLILKSKGLWEQVLQRYS
jgi:3-deoxy-D-manno-octulosonate 8-phosphate phosphatase (KDO 8-P phosphatase)